MEHAELLEERFKPGVHLGLRDIHVLQYGLHILGDGKLPEDRSVLGQVAYSVPCPLIHGGRGDVAVAERDAAFVRAHEPHYHVKSRGLSGAVRSEEHTSELQSLAY